MSLCPACSHSIENAFGLTECPSCHKILFADFDGALRIQDEGPSEAEEDSPIEAIPEPMEVESSPEFSNDWNVNLENPSPDLTLEESENVFEEPIRESPSLGVGAIQEINQFANSEESSLREGPLSYDLTIKNIDTEELKEEIMQVLKEARFNIDVQNLKWTLPTLELKDLNPVKVSVIVSRIKHLPIEMEWSQKSALIDGESSLE